MHTHTTHTTAAVVQSKTYSLVTAAYAVAELPTAEQRVAVTALLWRLVAPGGALVIIEHGDARGSHVVRSMRQVHCAAMYTAVCRCCQREHHCVCTLCIVAASNLCKLLVAVAVA
jgi:ribosomal protein RSM22 (predicted rRNA methylase)